MTDIYINPALFQLEGIKFFVENYPSYTYRGASPFIFDEILSQVWRRTENFSILPASNPFFLTGGIP
jgi:hypothetical protein